MALCIALLACQSAFFDSKYGMDATNLQRVLGKTLSTQIGYADLYFQYPVSDAVSLEEGVVKRASKHVNQGVGVRALAGEKTGYAFSDEITVSNLELAAQTARQIAERGADMASVEYASVPPPAGQGPATGSEQAGASPTMGVQFHSDRDGFPGPGRKKCVCCSYNPRCIRCKTSVL